MINGEETTSPDWFHNDGDDDDDDDDDDYYSPWNDNRKPEVTNASPDTPRGYSSCGDSEFERYCSANSVMNTPSMCSSVGTFNDFLDLDFNGPGKSFGENIGTRLGIEYGDRSVSSSGGFDCLLGGKIGNEDCSGNRDGENGLEVASGTSNLNNSTRISKYSDDSTRDLMFLSLEGGSELLPTSGGLGDENNEHVDNCCDHFDGNESGSEGEEGTLSMYEHSDDDGSMFNYGTEDEGRVDLCNVKNLHYVRDSVNNNENTLLMGSAVAFGSEDWDDFLQETEKNSLVSLSLNEPTFKKQENFRTEGTLVNSVSAVPVVAPDIGRSKQAEIVRNATETTCLASGEEDSESYSTRDTRVREKDFLAEEASLKRGLLNIKEGAEEGGHQYISKEEVICANVTQNYFLEKAKQLNSSSDMTDVRLSLSATTELTGKETVPVGEDDINICSQKITNHSPASVPTSEEHLTPIKVGHFELKESHDQVVLEMEEILFDSIETPGTRLPQSNRSPKPFRDGSSTASTSGTDDAYLLIQHPLNIDGVEVVGAKQRKGDVSLGERLVGVKEYIVYMLRVRSGKDIWEVERRYRDFFMLYRQLKTLYASHGWTLPTPWSRVEQESRKFFGNASPNVVSERTTLIQECLRSILHSGTLDSVQGTLNWFLSPHKTVSSPSLFNTLVPKSTSTFTGGTFAEEVPMFGKTITLLVEIQPRKSVKQLLEAQHYLCAGCHRCLDVEKTLIQDFVHTLGWGKPRLCEYTGQLFCTSCHTNETAVLPARVLHFWDFTEYPVSQMAKSYLDSIYDQPMLCVSAVNPFLFSKVPPLLHVMSIRKKIGAMMPYVRCPFRRSVQRGVGSRKYLIESNEFFALKDLVDLSKGIFAALPVMVETVSKKILDHITLRCLVCCDVGIPCSARQACEDPSSLIFPFQEDEVKRCRSCQSVFHKPCFRNLLHHCPCGVGSEVLSSAGAVPDVNQAPHNGCNDALDALARKPVSDSPLRFLSYLFKKRQGKELGRQKSNPFIRMGSLPSTFSDPL